MRYRTRRVFVPQGRVEVMKANIDNALLINYKDTDDFYYKWMLIVGRIYDLSKKECVVFSKILSYRHELSKTIFDNNQLDEACTNAISRERMAEELGMSIQQYMNITRVLAEKKLLKRYRSKNKRIVSFYYISPEFIPNYKDGCNTSLAFVFRMNSK